MDSASALERRISAPSVPSPLDSTVVGCYECHSLNPKAHALPNLQKNAIYHALVETVTGLRTVKGNTLSKGLSGTSAKNETCYGCNGTHIEVVGMKIVTTDAGEITVPNLTNWPNQGIGRGNPDGTAGSCTSCHPRHSFSLEIARKPLT